MFPFAPQELPIPAEQDQAMSHFMVQLLSSIWTSKPQPQILYHYSDPTGFQGIVETGVLRATHIAYTNDSKEYHHALELMLEVMSKRRQTATSDQLELIDDLHSMVSATTLFNMFPYGVVCFCEDPDKLSQWRAYGRGEGGIAIGFDAQKLGKGAPQTKSFLTPVIYDRHQQLELIEKLADWVLAEYARVAQQYSVSEKIEHRKNWLLVLGFRGAMLAPHFKNDGFKEENEWRVIRLFQNIHEVQFHPRISHLSPYVALPLGETRTHPSSWPSNSLRRQRQMPDKLPIREIWFGPARFSDPNYLACKTLLEIYDYDQVSLKRSQVPFRSMA